MILIVFNFYRWFSLNQTNGGGIAEREGHITWVCVFGLLRSLNEMDGKDLYSSNWGLLQVSTIQVNCLFNILFLYFCVSVFLGGVMYGTLAMAR